MVAKSARKAGRPCIATEAEAFAAIDALVKQGQRITVASVTQALGGGSTITISAFIRAWRRAQDEKFAAGGRLGAALSATVQQFWDEMEGIVKKEQTELLSILEAKLAACESELKRQKKSVRKLGDRNIALETENRILREQLDKKD